MIKLTEFLQEDNGGFSATRLAFLLWAIGVLIVWIINSLRTLALAAIDPSVATILGILMTGKVVQKFGEKPAGANGGPVTPATPGSTPAASGLSPLPPQPHAPVPAPAQVRVSTTEQI